MNLKGVWTWLVHVSNVSEQKQQLLLRDHSTTEQQDALMGVRPL